MKKILEYFYNIKVNNIIQENEQKFIIKSNQLYVVLIFLNNKINIEKILNAYDISSKINKTNKFIFNRQNEIMTNYNNKIYVVLKINSNYNKKIKLNDVLLFDSELQDVNLYKLKWKKLWMEKIDYFEYQINQFGLNYPLLRESSSYFFGLTENAIQLLNNKIYTSLYISHKRLEYNSTFYDLYDPFNIIVDSNIRDIVCYLKSGYLINKIKINEIIKFLNENDYIDSFLFLVRTMYINEYFDTFERIINNELEENSIKEIINKVPKIEELLKELLENEKFNIEIDWIKK